MLPPLVVQVIRETQERAIRAKGYAPDRDRYAHASSELWSELRANNAAATRQVQTDLQDTETLVRELGPLQNPVHLFGLVRYNREVLAVARRMRLADDTWVPFASATFGAVNAETTRVRQHHVIVYNDGLFFLTELVSSQLSFALGQMFSTGAASESLGDAARRTFAADSEVVRALVTTVTTYAVTGDPRRALEHVPGHLVVEDGVQRILRDTALRFVVAHELGHVYLNHLPDTPAGADPPGGSGRWGAELEADRFAARAAVGSMLDTPATPEHVDPFVEMLAIELQPMLFVLLSAAEDYLTYGGIRRLAEGEGTHPPSDRRFAHVRACVDAALSVGPAGDADAVGTVRGLVDFIVWALLPPLREECLALRARGVRPV